MFVTSMLEMDFGETQPVYRVGARDRYSQGVSQRLRLMRSDHHFLFVSVIHSVFIHCELTPFMLVPGTWPVDRRGFVGSVSPKRLSRDPAL